MPACQAKNDEQRADLPGRSHGQIVRRNSRGGSGVDRHGGISPENRLDPHPPREDGREQERSPPLPTFRASFWVHWPALGASPEAVVPASLYSDPQRRPWV